MGRSQKWPDLRSPISKIRDIRFVGTDDLIIFRKFHNFPWNIVAVVGLEIYFVVGSLDLTWWPDLTWHWVEIFTKVAEKMGDKVGENPAALRAAVFLLSAKNLRGGRSNAPPPAGRGLTPLAPELCSDTKYSEIIFHDACAVRIFALLDDVTHYCVTSAVEYYFRKWYDGFRWFRPVCHSTWRRSLSCKACVLLNETWEGLKLQKGFEYELSNTIVMSFILFSRFHSPHKGIRIRRTWPSPQAVEYSVKC